MLAKTLREHLAKEYRPAGDYTDHERLIWCIEDYFSSKGMEWTADDRAVIKEYGADPDSHLCFEDEQLCRIDEVYDAVSELAVFMTARPGYEKHLSVALIKKPVIYELADVIAGFLSRKGHDVYFPTHVDVGDEAGTEYISDYFERRGSR